MKRTFIITISSMAIAFSLFTATKAVAGDDIITAYQPTYTYPANTGNSGDDLEAVTPTYEAQPAGFNDGPVVEAAPVTGELATPMGTGSSEPEVEVVIGYDAEHGAIDCIRNPSLCHHIVVPGSSDDVPGSTSDPTGGTVIGSGHFVGTIDTEIPSIGGRLPGGTGTDGTTTDRGSDTGTVRVDNTDSTNGPTNCTSCHCTSGNACPQGAPEVSTASLTDTGPSTSDFMAYQGVGGCSLMSANPSSGILSALVLALCALPIAFVRRMK